MSPGDNRVGQGSFFSVFQSRGRGAASSHRATGEPPPPRHRRDTIATGESRPSFLVNTDELRDLNVVGHLVEEIKANPSSVSGIERLGEVAYYSKSNLVLDRIADALGKVLEKTKSASKQVAALNSFRQLANNRCLGPDTARKMVTKLSAYRKTIGEGRRSELLAEDFRALVLAHGHAVGNDMLPVIRADLSVLWTETCTEEQRQYASHGVASIDGLSASADRPEHTDSYAAPDSSANAPPASQAPIAYAAEGSGQFYTSVPSYDPNLSNYQT